MQVQGCRGSGVQGLAASSAFAVGLSVALIAQAPRVELTGLAVMPADTFAEGPPSGAFRTSAQAGKPEFRSQPVQGVSSIRPDGQGDADWLALIDNGFGTRMNSPDSLLRIYRLHVDWAKGLAGPARPFIQLNDASHHLPFHLVRGDTNQRWLTGGDLDPESLVRIPDGSFWIGDEFGPYLVHVDATGRVIGQPHGLTGFASPDAPGDLPPDAGQASAAQIRRSRGFEGLAVDSIHRYLYAALEATPIGDPAGTTRVIEFDTLTNDWTGRWWRYPLDANDQGVTELVGLGEVFGARCDGRFLAIERDNMQGDTARFKRVFEVTLGTGATGAAMPLQTTKQLVADLLDVDNPRGLGGLGARFAFPYITTEALWPVDPHTLVLVNDNNYPATGGRGPQKDVTEFIRLRLPMPLCGR